MFVPRALIVVLGGAFVFAGAACADESSSPRLSPAPSANASASPTVRAEIVTSTPGASTPTTTPSRTATPSPTPPSATATQPPPPPTPAPGTREVVAPIITIEVLSNGDGSAVARITSGLPDGCHRYGRAAVSRLADVVKVEVFNTIPAATNLVCTQVFGYVTNDVPLGGGFALGVPYTIDVNGVRQTFTLR